MNNKLSMYILHVRAVHLLSECLTNVLFITLWNLPCLNKVFDSFIQLLRLVPSIISGVRDERRVHTLSASNVAVSIGF